MLYEDTKTWQGVLILIQYRVIKNWEKYTRENTIIHQDFFPKTLRRKINNKNESCQKNLNLAWLSYYWFMSLSQKKLCVLLKVEKNTSLETVPFELWHFFLKLDEKSNFIQKILVVLHTRIGEIGKFSA